VGFAPPATTGTSTTATVSTTAATPTGAHQVTITGSGAGGVTASVVVTVTVTAIPGSITLSLASPALSVTQGQSGNVALTINRTNFTGSVALTSAGAPAGVMVDFNPPSTTGLTSTVTVTVPGATPTGTSQITITASGTGVSNATIVLTLTVTQSAGGGNVTFTFCAQSGIPLWLAYQNLGGAWTAVTPVNNAYNFNINPRGIVAWVLPDGAKTKLEVYYGSTSELAARGSSLCRGNGTTKSVNVTVTGLGMMDVASVALGGATTQLFGGVGNTAQLTNVPDGLVDLFVSRQTVDFPLVTSSVVVQSDLNPANGSTIMADVSVANAVNRTATIANLGADNASMLMGFLTKNGTVGSLFVDGPGTTTSRPWAGVPDALTANHWHQQQVIATTPGAVNGYPFRAVQQFNRLAADRTYTLPAHITAPTLAVQGTAPYVRINHTWTIQSAEFNDYWSITYTPASGNVSSVTISGTSDYFGSGPVRLDLPTFDASFNPQHGLQPGVQLTWTFLAAGGTAWGTTGNVPRATEGAISTTAGVSGQITP
jgi:hypothetical protein